MQKTITAQGIASKWVALVVLITAVAMLSGFVLGRSAGTWSADTRGNPQFEQMLLQARALNSEENATAERDTAFQKYEQMMVEARAQSVEENAAAERDAEFAKYQGMLVQARTLNIQENAAAERDAAFRDHVTN